MRAIAVHDPSQVAEARRAAVAVARRLGFDEADAGRVAGVATELATNLLKHGGGGELLAGAYEDPGGTGVECLALDKGAGMADLAGSLADGRSTAGSLGIGLGAVLRGSHLVDIYSRPGQGTAILARLQTGRPDHAAPAVPAAWGAVNLPLAGEEACGDAWSVQPHPAGLKLLVADGLGHGPLAAEASHAAIQSFLADPAPPPAELIERMHLALRTTRGAALAVADLDVVRGRVVFAGIGNIAGVVATPGAPARRMVSHNGTAGHMARRFQEFTYPFAGTPLVVMCSDGLATSWTLDAYPGLAQRHPSLIAGVLYRDFQRGRDDVTVLVARGAAV